MRILAFKVGDNPIRCALHVTFQRLNSVPVFYCESNDLVKKEASVKTAVNDKCKREVVS